MPLAVRQTAPLAWSRAMPLAVLRTELVGDAAAAAGPLLVAGDAAGGAADGTAGLVLGAGAALLTVDATVDVVADVADAAEAVGEEWYSLRP